MRRASLSSDNSCYVIFAVYKHYRISSVIRRGFFSFQNNPKVLDPSCKTDLELWHCLGRVELVL